MQLTPEQQAQLDKVVLVTRITGKLPGGRRPSPGELGSAPRSVDEALENAKRNSCHTLEDWRDAHYRAYLSSIGVDDPSVARRIVQYWQEHAAVPFSQMIFDMMCGEGD